VTHLSFCKSLVLITLFILSIFIIPRRKEGFAEVSKNLDTLARDIDLKINVGPSK